MTHALQDALSAATSGLAAMQCDDGRFEGALTSNTYPTLACALIDTLRAKPIPDDTLSWLAARQLTDGRFPLDPEGVPSDEATRFARVALNASLSRTDGNAAARAADVLARTPDLGWDLWLVKVLGALADQYPWHKLPPPATMAIAGRIAGAALGLLPKRLKARIPTPTRLAPPVSLFYQRSFDAIFIAEQYTLAPMLLLIEAHTRRRERVLRHLTTWILSRQAVDGSWFCVTFITAVSTLALMVAAERLPDERTSLPLRRAFDWLSGTRNADGGHREAVSLNVWDTALSARALMDAGFNPKAPAITQAADWLVQAQNQDGGWAFHDVRGNALPSDADDTALATVVLLRTGRAQIAAERGLSWLRDKQARDGSWATYVPGKGDVGCVSVTAHAIETLLIADDPDPVDRAVKWLRRRQHRTGFWEDLWLARKTYGTASALLALQRAGRGDTETAARGVRWLLDARNEDGGWGETQAGTPAASTAEQTGVCVQALVACGADAASGVEWLHRHQRPDGGWDASPIGIYWEVIGGYANPINAWVFPISGLAEASGQAPGPLHSRTPAA